jgi:hypothetical protein
MNAAILSPHLSLGWTSLMVYRFMKRAYDIRSSIVHGTAVTEQSLRVNSVQMTIDQFVMYSDCIVQTSILWAIREFQPGTAISMDWSTQYFPKAAASTLS